MNIKFDKDIIQISKEAFVCEQEYISNILPDISYDFRLNDKISKRAISLIESIRNDSNFGVEQFLQKYNLGTDEGIAILCLAESLLRIPDSTTANYLILDKLGDKNWSKYIGFAKTRLVELSSLGLFALGKMVDLHSVENAFTKISSKISDPVTLFTIKQAIKFLGKEFIIGEDIESGFKNARKNPSYLYSFDLLGESSRTKAQAEKYYKDYLKAIDKLSFYFPCCGENIFERPNLSIKLSALFPRVEALKISEVEANLIPKLVEIISLAQDHRITITFDAEEARRQDVYLHVLKELINKKQFKDFEGIGFVVQAYQKRASSIIDFVIKLSKQTKKQIPLRLVKGAYWDSEIKYAQENGLKDFPVFTSKEHTDANYLYCAKKILLNAHKIYPQFATHNALTAASVIELANSLYESPFENDAWFEMQKLYGMGNSLHQKLVEDHKVRIYAPIGKMEDLLAYLMRRLLENGANVSFINKVNTILDAKELVKPVSVQVMELQGKPSSVAKPKDIYPNRNNSLGTDLGYSMNIEKLQTELSKYSNKTYIAGSIINGNEIISPKHSKEKFRPGSFAEKIGEVSHAKEKELKDALEIAHEYFNEWSKTDTAKRSDYVRKFAILLQENQYQLYSLLIQEGGKSIADAIAELREAIDFCNYYANVAEKLIEEKILPGPTGERNTLSWHPRGVFLCISPWNFPLAIFVGQIVAALVSGNTVLAKPAEQTSLIANFIAKLAYNAGVPHKALQLLLAPGSKIGEVLIPDDRIKGVAFTGSTDTAKRINLTLAHRKGAIVPLIAETGGQNAMIVDSSALLEQVCDDVIQSAFYSAGQRCSALRVLYVQEEIYQPLIQLIVGSMSELKIGDTTDISNDIGAVIDENSKDQLTKHVENMQEKGFKLIASHHSQGSSSKGHYFFPQIIEINSINDLESENFGPILHVCKYKEKELDKVIDEINNYGYGLTFGIQTRIDKKIKDVTSKVNAGNMYVNRSIIGAQVESQPFGGENMSGTGFKAGGPHYLMRFMTERSICINLSAIGGNIDLLKG